MEVWRGDREGIHKSDNYLLVNYTYLLAGLYNWIGHELLAAKWINALVGALTSVATFRLALYFTSTAGGASDGNRHVNLPIARLLVSP